MKAAERTLHARRERLVKLRTAGNQLCHEIVAELRYKLRTHTPAHRRAIMRSYGVRFRTGEAPPG